MLIRVCDRCGECEPEVALQAYIIPDFDISSSKSECSEVYEYQGERVRIKKIDLCSSCAESLRESLKVWEEY